MSVVREVTSCRSTLPSSTYYHGFSFKVALADVEPYAFVVAQCRYDFVPQTLNVRPNDHIHFQWTGSDFNPLNYDGEGTPGTDRSNFVQGCLLSCLEHLFAS